jgi:hypothetical protein
MGIGGPRVTKVDGENWARKHGDIGTLWRQGLPLWVPCYTIIVFMSLW